MADRPYAVTTQFEVWNLVCDYVDFPTMTHINTVLAPIHPVDRSKPVTVEFSDWNIGQKCRQLADEVEIAMGIPG
jgi:hypothetical protein